MSQFGTAEVKTGPNPDWFTQKSPEPQESKTHFRAV